MIEAPGFSFAEWDELLRLNESGEKQEACRRFLAGNSIPKQWKRSKYPIREVDKREYNLIVSLQDNGDKVAARMLLLNLARSQPGEIPRFEAMKPSANDLPEFRINIIAQIVNRCIFPLNPRAA